MTGSTNPVTQEQLLEAILKITRQRDIDMLTCCLIKNLSDLIPESDIRVYKLTELNLLTNASNNLHFLSEFSEDSCANRDTRCDISIDCTDKKALLECIINNKPIEFSNITGHFLVFPILKDNSVIGALHIAFQSRQNTDQSLIKNILSIYQNYLLILTESERDKLTGLFNRKTFDKKLERLLKLQSEQQSGYAKNTAATEHRQLHADTHAWLAIIDIDHFKLVNDNYGHLIGDEVLLMLSQLMRQNFRSDDLLFRFGGEEFVIVLSPSSLDNAFIILNRFRAAIQNHNFPQVGTVTISTGFSRITDKDYPARILEYADKALYYVKHNGRNNTFNYEQLVAENKLEVPEEKNDIELF